MMFPALLVRQASTVSTRTAFVALLALSAPLAAQNTATPPEPTESARYDGCIRAIPTNAADAEQYAIEWRSRGGGLPARHCQALAQLQQGRHGEAAANLAAAAQVAEGERSPFAADFWAQAGNAALLSGNAANARVWLTTALVQAGDLPAERRADFHIDRARVETEQGDLAAARADLNSAVQLAPENALGWLLSAALARRQDDLARASRDIARASELSPSDPDVMLEQANIAAANGDMATAQKVWKLVQQAAPDSEAARIAKKTLSANE